MGLAAAAKNNYNIYKMQEAFKPILISVEGDIGAGKTTLIDKLKQQNPEWHFIKEPVETWQSLKTEDGRNLLELFYTDKERYSYTFQNCALLSRALNIKRTIDEWKKRCMMNPEEGQFNVFVTERCLETDYYVFAQMLRDDGLMNLVEWDLYKMWYNYIKEQSYPLSGIVYVSTPPAICHERIHIRGRKGEETIPIEYLNNLDVYQKKWLKGDMGSIKLMDYKNYGEEQTDVTNVIDFIERFNMQNTL
jgi:deoxyadenosine/deoxycytidine kinase